MPVQAWAVSHEAGSGCAVAFERYTGSALPGVRSQSGEAESGISYNFLPAAL
ncbi:hypothetical protein OG948_53200 (plasmid) [Embleya sp. NBC_00888]|uniref:hypothetical protein n=1 Tax=Embleya sp. NBC_00888 TaxID=2975960 RepID=UPI002F9195EA|nr:hypothetical protein OG948_53200 [Embleya sp. NBC_00888]